MHRTCVDGGLHTRRDSCAFEDGVNLSNNITVEVLDLANRGGGLFCNIEILFYRLATLERDGKRAVCKVIVHGKVDASVVNIGYDYGAST